MEERMATLVAEAEVNRAHLESSAAILGQQQQLEEAARKQVSHCFMCVFVSCLVVTAELCCRHILDIKSHCSPSPPNLKEG